MALPPLLPPEVIALLLPWLPVDRPEDRQDELQQFDQTGFRFQPPGSMWDFSPPARTEHPRKLDATPHHLAPAPMGAPAVAMVVPAQQRINIQGGSGVPLPGDR